MTRTPLATATLHADNLAASLAQGQLYAGQSFDIAEAVRLEVAEGNGPGSDLQWIFDICPILLVSALQDVERTFAWCAGQAETLAKDLRTEGARCPTHADAFEHDARIADQWWQVFANIRNEAKRRRLGRMNRKGAA